MADSGGPSRGWLHFFIYFSILFSFFAVALAAAWKKHTGDTRAPPHTAGALEVKRRWDFLRAWKGSNGFALVIRDIVCQLPTTATLQSHKLLEITTQPARVVIIGLLGYAMLCY